MVYDKWGEGRSRMADKEDRAASFCSATDSEDEIGVVGGSNNPANRPVAFEQSSKPKTQPCYSPFSGLLMNSHRRSSPLIHCVTQTTSSSSLDAFFSLRIGKTVTAGIRSCERAEGIGSHRSQAVSSGSRGDDGPLNYDLCQTSSTPRSHRGTYL